MRRIESLAQVKQRDGIWKRRVVGHWQWCDETTGEICGVLKISRPLLMQWHRWHNRTRHLLDKAPAWEVPLSILSWQKRQEMKNQELEKNLASDKENVESLQKQIVSLQAALTQEKLKVEAFSTMIDIAEEAFKIEIRKKSGAKRSRD